MALSYNLATISKLVNAAFDLNGLTDFCFFHFRPVYEQFQETDRKSVRVRMLIDYAERKGELARLLTLLQEENPGKYQEFAGALHRPTPPSDKSKASRAEDDHPAGSSAKTGTPQIGDEVSDSQLAVSPGPPNTPLWRWLVTAGILIAMVAGLVAIVSDSLNVFSLLGNATPAVLEVRQSQEDALQDYFDAMDDLIIREGLRDSQPDNPVRELARSRTVSVLQRLDGDNKRLVLQFLLKSELIGQPALVDLREANFAGASLAGLALQGANLSGANLAQANLRSTDLTGANLSEADLFQADLSLADLTDTDLSDAYLAEAKLVRVNLAAATLANNDLAHATLRFSNLAGINGLGLNLSGADLSYARLHGANLENAFIDEELILEEAQYDAATVWPAKIDPATAGAVLVEE